MLSIDINGQQAVMNKLDDVVKAVGSPKEALEETGNYLVDEFKANFQEEGGRLGSPWQELKQATRQEKQRLGYGSKPILVRTGKLMDSFAKEVSTWAVRVFNTASYYKYHQLGMPPQPKRTMIKRTENISGGVFEIFQNFIRKHL